MNGRLAAFSCTVVLIGCAKATAPYPNKNTNWLRECISDRTCGAGLSCLCGVCTATCTSAQQCGESGPTAVCARTSGSALKAQCKDEPTGSSVCAASCKRSSDCDLYGPGFECRSATCTKVSAAAPADAGAPAAADAASDGGRPSASVPDGGSRNDGSVGAVQDMPMTPSSCGNGVLDANEACDGTQGFAHGHCAACQVLCDQGYADCNGDLADGCERNVGASNLPPALGAPAGCVEVLHENLQAPTSVAIDATNLYWTANQTRDGLGNPRNDGKVIAMPLGGGPLVTVADGLHAPLSLVIQGSHAYFVEQGYGATHNAVLRVPRSGGTVETVEDHPFSIYGLAVDDTYAYYFANLANGGTTYDAPREVRRKAKTGTGTPDVLLSNTPAPLAMTVSQGILYWKRDADGEIDTLAADGSNGLQKVTDDSDWQGPTDGHLVVDGGVLYWLYTYAPFASTVCGLGTFALDTKVGNAFGEAPGRAMGLAVDARYAYWGHAPGNGTISLERTDKQTGATDVLLVGVPGPTVELAVSASDVYVLASDGGLTSSGLVLRVPK